MVVTNYNRRRRLVSTAMPNSAIATAIGHAVGMAVRHYGQATPPKDVVMKSGSTSIRGTLGGFAGKRRKGAKTRKGGKRKTRKRLARKRKYGRKVLAEGGVEFQGEEVGKLTDANAVYIGHASFAPQNFTKYICYCMVKMILNRAGVIFTNWNIVAGGAELPAGSTISFAWRDTMISSLNNFTVTVANADTYDTIGNAFWSAFYTEINNGTLSEKSIPEYIWVDKGTSAATKDITKVNMNNVSFDVFAKDSLKVQNRTVSALADNEITDVNSVPLTGKMYFSRGNYFESKNELADEDLVAARITNVLAVSANTDTYLFEPPQAYYFKDTTSMPVRLAPGEIKTHTHTFKRTLSMRSFLSWAKSFWYNTALQSDEQNRHSMGQVAMLGLEKVIGTGLDATGIEIKYEVDQHMWVKCRVREVNYTNQIRL